jgi:hypothetical protein
MEAGEFDVIDTLSRNERREQLYDFTEPYATFPVPLFFHTDISSIHGPENAAGCMVAAKACGNVLDAPKKHGVTNIVEYPSYEKIIEAARNGQVKVFTVDRPPAMYYLHKMAIRERFRETLPMCIPANFTGPSPRATQPCSTLSRRVLTNFRTKNCDRLTKIGSVHLS